MSSAVNLIVAAGRVDGLQDSVQKRKRQARPEARERRKRLGVYGLCSAQFRERLRARACTST